MDYLPFISVSDTIDTEGKEVSPVRKILEACPTCGGPLEITTVRCEDCATEVRSAYAPCPFCRLTAEQISFVLLFLQNRGNLSEMEKALGVSLGHTTADGMFSFEVARCIGACGLAPAMSIDATVYPHVKADEVKGILQSWYDKDAEEAV